MLILFELEGTFTSFFKDKQSTRRNQGFSWYFCLLMEGSGSAFIQINYGSGCGSRRPKTHTNPDPQHCRKLLLLSFNANQNFPNRWTQKPQTLFHDKTSTIGTGIRIRLSLIKSYCTLPVFDKPFQADLPVGKAMHWQGGSLGGKKSHWKQKNTTFCNKVTSKSQPSGEKTSEVSRIPDPIIKKRGEKICCLNFFCSHKFHKIIKKIILFLNAN